MSSSIKGSIGVFWEKIFLIIKLPLCKIIFYFLIYPSEEDKNILTHRNKYNPTFKFHLIKILFIINLALLEYQMILIPYVNLVQDTTS